MLTFTTYNRFGGAPAAEEMCALAALATINAALRAGCSVEPIPDEPSVIHLCNPHPGANSSPDWVMANLSGIPEEGEA